MKISGINSNDVKRLNRLTVLKYLSQYKGISRMELTAKTGLTKMTISNIIAEFLDKELIANDMDTQPNSSSAGRKPTGLQFSGNSPIVAGVWVSRDFCIGIITDLHLATIVKHIIPFQSETKETVARKLIELIQSMLSGINRPLLGIGIASIGPLDIEKGILLNPPNFFDINNFNYKDIIEKQFSCPVFVQNDMNAAALAEKYFGFCKDVKNFAYVGLSNGIGAGIIVNDNLFQGANGFAGEIGHITIDHNGAKCHCGNNGCLEIYTSSSNLIRAFNDYFKMSLTEFSEVCKYCLTNAEGNKWLLEQMDLFILGLVNLSNTVDPHILVLGHEAALLGEETLKYIQYNLNNKILATGFTNIKVVNSSFGTLAPMFGASAIVLEKLFQGKILLEQSAC